MECEQGKSWNRGPYRFDCFICNIYSYKSPILLCCGYSDDSPSLETKHCIPRTFTCWGHSSTRDQSVKRRVLSVWNLVLTIYHF